MKPFFFEDTSNKSFPSSLPIHACSLNFFGFKFLVFGFLHLSPSFSHLCFTSKTSCATPLAVDQGIAPDSSWTDLWALDASNLSTFNAVPDTWHSWHSWHSKLSWEPLLDLDRKEDCSSAAGPPRPWVKSQSVDGRCDRWDRGDSLESFPKFWETIAALAETSPHISCQKLKLTFLNPWLGLLALQNIPNITVPTPKWALVLGSGHWRPGICVLRRTSSRSRCPRIRCLISKPKKRRLRREHGRNITAPCNEPCTHLLDSPHCTMRHPVAAHAACAYSDLQGSVHIYRICAYLPKLSPNFVDNRHPQALSAPSCMYQPPVASRALP